MTNWLVIWNIFLFSTKKKWDNHSNWRTHIFQDGRSTTNQLRVWYRLLWKPWPMAGDAPLPGTTPSSNSKHSNEPKPNDGGGNSNVDLLDLWNYVRYVLCKLCLFLLKKTIWLYDFICVDFLFVRHVDSWWVLFGLTLTQYPFMFYICYHMLLIVEYVPRITQAGTNIDTAWSAMKEPLGGHWLKLVAWAITVFHTFHTMWGPQDS